MSVHVITVSSYAIQDKVVKDVKLELFKKFTCEVKFCIWSKCILCTFFCNKYWVKMDEGNTSLIHQKCVKNVVPQFPSHYEVVHWNAMCMKCFLNQHVQFGMWFYLIILMRTMSRTCNSLVVKIMQSCNFVNIIVWLTSLP